MFDKYFNEDRTLHNTRQRDKLKKLKFILHKGLNVFLSIKWIFYSETLIYLSY